MRSSRLLTYVFGELLFLAAATAQSGSCRNQPGDPGFPTQAQWSQLNADVGGRLVVVVPSALYCYQQGRCTQDQLSSSVFRSAIPGSMDLVNWEQDYLSDPPSLCIPDGQPPTIAFQNGTCGQGNVPLYAVNATSAEDIQAGVRFATQYNLRLVIKASGHDFLGRSTARNSLLLWTHQLQNISFTNSFVAAGNNYGSAVTVGSGVPLRDIYTASKAQGKIFVGGNAASVVAAGGYAQGAGHSPYGPLFGLAADNTLEFNVVLANGSLVRVNEAENPDLFWAMRGGGAGSWGVIVSATFRTFPTFNATAHAAQFFLPTNASVGAFIELHARHIFDWDAYRAGQYLSLTAIPGGVFVELDTYLKNATAADANAALAPLLDDARAMNFTVLSANTTTGVANDLVYSTDDNYLGGNAILGSRLVPADAYRSNPAGIGQGYAALFEQGNTEILGLLVGGGQVSANANISSAVNPKWRTAKSHVVVISTWPDSLPPSGVELLKQRMTHASVPVLARMTGEADSGAYSNEADVREPHFQTTFFGPNYARLEAVKRAYDPEGLFIVGAGVGSEAWDAAGLCRV